MVYSVSKRHDGTWRNFGEGEEMNLLEQKYGQALQMTICEGAETNAEDCGHWYSPDAVKQIVKIANLELAKLREERDALRRQARSISGAYDMAEATIKKLEQERDALAATVESLRDALEIANSGLWHRIIPQNHTDILAARDARVKAAALRDAADHLESFEYLKTQPPVPYAEAIELRRMADAIEKGGA